MIFAKALIAPTEDCSVFLKYITCRIESKCTFTNMSKVMKWRHEHIYKRIYDLEMKLHKNDEIKVLKCLRKSWPYLKKQ